MPCDEIGVNGTAAVVSIELINHAFSRDNKTVGRITKLRPVGCVLIFYDIDSVFAQLWIQQCSY